MWRTPESVVPTCDIYSDFLEERAKTRPPAQVDVPFGCVLLRDVRVSFLLFTFLGYALEI